MEPPQKRQRTGISDGQSDSPRTLSTPVSPPTNSRKLEAQRLTSPWQLTWVRDLPAELNKDAVTLKDVLGDPLICECWEFNFLHDIAFLMDAFDPDTRHLVNVHVVHGFWKREDANRVALSEQAAQYENVELHVAPMPEVFGTHHSKMMILFRRDDTAEIVIHTANMIAKDWTNMTNAVWRSPRLSKWVSGRMVDQDDASLSVGSGKRFKRDLINYLGFYDRRKMTCRPLADKLRLFDFSPIKAAFIASVPGRHKVHDMSTTPFGWNGLQRTLRDVACVEGKAEIVAQVSSIATLGARKTWLEKTFFESLASCKHKDGRRPAFKVVFPTADEIRASLDGYASGASVHTKIQSVQQAAQLLYLRPILHHWANDCRNGVALLGDVEVHDSGRARAAPHVKTYTRFNDKGSIDWALLTSANLSKQAWGEASTVTGEMRIASWEVGVLVWPELYGKDSCMMGTYQTDTPSRWGCESEAPRGPLVGIRMPYNMPLQRYGAREIPWVATMDHAELDCHGQPWSA